MVGEPDAGESDAGESDAGDVPWSRRAGTTGQEYDARWRRMEAEGVDPHGEANFVAALGPDRVLDAGCGTGRVAIELGRRGIEVVGVDLDPDMLAVARGKAPHLHWEHADLAGLDLRDADARRRHFDVVVMAGNVMIFLAPGTEGAVIGSLTDHLGPGGLLVAGFQLRPGGLDLAAYDDHADAAGLEPVRRHGGWDAEPFVEGGGYVVAVHRRRP